MDSIGSPWYCCRWLTTESHRPAGDPAYSTRKRQFYRRDQTEGPRHVCNSHGNRCTRPVFDDWCSGCSQCVWIYGSGYLSDAGISTPYRTRSMCVWWPCLSPPVCCFCCCWGSPDSVCGKSFRYFCNGRRCRRCHSLAIRCEFSMILCVCGSNKVSIQVSISR